MAEHISLIDCINFILNLNFDISKYLTGGRQSIKGYIADKIFYNSKSEKQKFDFCVTVNSFCQRILSEKDKSPCLFFPWNENTNIFIPTE